MVASKQALTEWRHFWFLPIVAALGYATSVIHIYSFGPFIEPLQQEFGWSRGQASMGITVAAFGSAIFCIPIGILIDRIGPRRVGLTGIILMGLTVALLASATGGMANWLLLWGIIAAANLWVQATVWTSAVNSRFEASRGMALAITLSGASVAATIFPFIATWLIGNYGWRIAFIALSGIWVALVFPFLLFFFRGAQDDTKEHAVAGRSPQKVLRGLTLAQGIRSSALYKLLLVGWVFAFTVIGVTVHFVPVLTDSGAKPLNAAGVASLIGIFSIVGRLTTGVLLDRFRGHLVGAIACFLPVIGSGLLFLDGSNPVNQTLAAIAFGLTLGAEVDVIAYLAAKYFGLKNFGALYGALVMALSLGTAFGPLVAGSLHDYFGSYAEFLILTSTLMVISAIALLTMGSTPTAEEIVARDEGQE